MATWSKRELRRLFREQISTLERFKVFPVVISYLKSARDLVVEKTYRMNVQPGRIPFLAVIPGDFFFSPYSELPLMMRNDTKIGGAIEVSPEIITDLAGVPGTPYFILDVDDGLSALGRTLPETVIPFDQEGRRGLTSTEAMALASHTDVLSKANIFAPASSYGRDYIGLCLNHDDFPLLSHRDYRDVNWPRWAIPSCNLETVCRHPASAK